MAINNDAEKRGLANSYGDKLLQKDEKLKSLLGDNYDFVRYAGYYAQTKLYKELVAAMKNPDFCPSEYITEHLFPVIGAAIPERNKEVILYFADKIRDYPYADSLYRRSFRSGEYRAYTNKIANLIGENGSTRPLFDQPLDKILNGDITDEELACSIAEIKFADAFNASALFFSNDFITVLFHLDLPPIYFSPFGINGVAPEKANISAS